MLSATRQLIGMLEELEALRRAGEGFSPAQVNDLFRVRDEAKAEIAALAEDHHTELDPPPAGEDGRELHGAEAARALADYFNQDAPAATPPSAAPSHPAEGAARVEAVADDPLDRAHERLQRALAAGPPPARRRVKRRTRKAVSA